MREVFEVVPRKWRGVGEIPAERAGPGATRIAPSTPRRASTWPIRRADEPAECISGLHLQGLKKPHECPAFGTRCTPEHPLGATMVSSEGACAAYYRYRRARIGCEAAVAM